MPEQQYTNNLSDNTKKDLLKKNNQQQKQRLSMHKYPGKYIFNWLINDFGEFAVLQFDRIKQHKNGDIKARLHISAKTNNGEANLHQGQLNLVAPRSRKEISNLLKERLKREGLQWDYLIEETCRRVVDAEEDTTEAEQLSYSDAKEPEFVVYPCIVDRLPVVWYGPGAAGKTMLAMYFALLVQNGLPFMGQDIKQRNVLYLDWEVDKEEASRRASFFARYLEEQFQQEIQFPYYRQCLLPLFDEASSIAEDVSKNNVGLVFIDSAGPACGGDIMSAELAIQYFNSLRKICASKAAASVTLTHVTKSERRDAEQGRMPIGTIYFENYPRFTWEMKPQETPSEEKISVGFFCRKTNFRKPKSFGFEITFNETKAYPKPITPEDVKSDEKVLEEIILDELSTGPMHVKELSEATGTTISTIQKTVSQAQKKGKVTRIKKGTYALAYRDDL